MTEKHRTVVNSTSGQVRGKGIGPGNGRMSLMAGAVVLLVAQQHLIFHSSSSSSPHPLRTVSLLPFHCFHIPRSMLGIGRVGRRPGSEFAANLPFIDTQTQTTQTNDPPALRGPISVRQHDLVHHNILCLPPSRPGDPLPDHDPPSRPTPSILPPPPTSRPPTAPCSRPLSARARSPASHP